MKASNDSTILSDGKYIYEGWNLIAKYNLSGSTLTRQKVHYWGPDISGSLQGAGGVGGLVATKVEVGTTGTYYTGYDPNGNVTEMFNSSGANVAHYEYDAFGKTINSAGAQVADFKFRFSTKFWDDESSLYYYGYRYYDPNNGRWLNRDPIEEEGGLNLYGFVGNDPLSNTDYLGNQSEAWRKPDSWDDLNNAIRVRQGRKPALVSDTNLCGTPGFLTDVPESPPGAGRVSFSMACLHHDLCWTTCAGKGKFDSHRKKCDKAFREQMRAACVAEYGGIFSVMFFSNRLSKCLIVSEVY